MPRKQKIHHYIYKTTCQMTGKFYVGMHSTNNLDDGYLGSGKILGYSRKKHGDENHKKEILEFCTSREALKLREKEIVNEKLLADPLNINLKYGGEGGWGDPHLQSLRGKKGGIKGNATMAQLRVTDPNWAFLNARHISDGLRAAYIDGSRTVTVPNWTGRNHRAETKRKIGDVNKMRSVGKGNSQFGTCWITDGNKSMKIKKDDLQRYLENGYRHGRTMGTVV